MDEQFCYHCMRSGMQNGKCPHCGRSPEKYQKKDEDVLPRGATLLNGRFLVGEKLGRGGFGVTYIALDTQKQQLVALKEFFPKHLVERTGLALRPKNGQEAEYERTQHSFSREAKTLDLLRQQPHIVNVLCLFNENNTVYYAMELLHGMDLKRYISKLGRKLTMAEAFALLIPVMDALQFSHEKGVLHHDVSPDNIFLCIPDDAAAPPQPRSIRDVKLIDFGAAHVAVNSFTQSYPGVKKNGYSPLEQNWEAQYQGPHTDEYALCATFYYLITGQVPLPAIDRSADADTMPAPRKLGADISPQAETVLLTGMSLRPQSRYGSIAALRDAMEAALKGRPAPKLSPAPKPSPNASVREASAPRRTETSLEPRDTKADTLPWQRILSLLVDMLLCNLVPSLFLTDSSILLCYPFMALATFCMHAFTAAHATLGEMLFGLTVRTQDGGAPTLAQYAGRDALRSLSGLALVFEIAMAASGKPTYYDQCSHTTVCFQRPSAQPQAVAASEAVGKAPAPREALTLRFTQGALKGRAFGVATRLRIGRDPARADALVPAEDAAVSGLHCSVLMRHGKPYLLDEGSRNGTRLNGQRIVGEKELRNGDRIGLGREEMIVHFNPSAKGD